MFQNQSLDVVFTQSRFEKSINTIRKKDLGVFLTNNIKTIDNILDVIDFDDSNILGKKFLEPSCGNGVFIIRLLEKVFHHGVDEKTLLSFIENNIFFVDIDEKMVATTKKNISKYYSMLFGKEYKGNFNAYVFDFTKRIKPKNQSLFDSLLDVPLSKQLNTIDYVIGNPPYVTLYGRRDRKQDEAQRVYYLNSYSQFPSTLKNGKINYVMLFIEQSIDLLKDGGKLSFIIDLAFFETAYEHTRKYLLENTKIISIEHNIKDFEVASGQVILKVQKSHVVNNIVTIIDTENNSKIKVDQFVWKNPKDQYKFRFNTCSFSSQIIDKIKARHCKSLKNLYPNKNLRTCVMLLNMEDLFVFDKPNYDLKLKIYPYIQGSKGLSEKYGKLKNTKYFHFNKPLQDKVNDELKEELEKQGIKNKKRLGLGETIIYDNPKIYIRQSAKEIIASYEELPSAANNSLYVFSLRNSDTASKIFLKYLCGLLNSELITFYGQQERIIRYSKGKQPQIKTSDLYAIPVPTDKDIQNRISKIVDDIYLGKNIDENKNKIDEIIYSYFEINNDEICTIKEAIESF